MRRGRRLPVLLLLLPLLLLLLAAPGASAAERPGSLEVAPTRSLDLDALTTRSRVRGGVEVTNDRAAPRRVRLGPLPGSADPRPARLRISRDGVVLWSGTWGDLAQRPRLPGSLAPGRTWRLEVTATVRPGEVEVAGVQATRDDVTANRADDGVPGQSTDETADETGDEPGDAVLAVDSLDPAGHRISLRVQLVCSLLLAGGLLWIAAAFRVEARRRQRR